MSAGKKNVTLLLTRLQCYVVEEHEFDDVYLKYNGKKIWPKEKRQQPITMDSTTVLDVTIEGIHINQQVIIELWEWDLISLDDKLGTFTLQVDGTSGAYSTDMSQNLKETNKAKYTLEWEIS